MVFKSKIQRCTLAPFPGTDDDIGKNGRTNAPVLVLWQHLDFSDFNHIFGLKELNNAYRLAFNRHDRNVSGFPKLGKVSLMSSLIPSTPGGVE